MKLNTLKLFLTLTLIVSTITLKAQIIYVGAGGGGGTFQMNSVKEFNQNIINQLAFKPVVKDNFPPYFLYKAELIYSLPDNLSLGINGSMASTGCRYTIADYSGKYTMDNIQRGLFSGIKLLYGTSSGYLNGFNLSLEGGVAFSKMVVNEELQISEESQKDNMELKATGFYVQPGICYFMNIIPHIKFAANISYYIGFERGYHLPNARNQILYNQKTGNAVIPQWDGIRVGITAYWGFRNNSK